MNISPVIFEIGPIQLRWYGVMYLLGYVLGGYILTVLSKKGFFKIPKDKIDPYIAYLLGGMVVGARLAYVFIYNWPYYAHHLDEIIAVWKGGLSFHGAVAGMCFSTWLYARKFKLHFFQVSDCLALAGTPGLFLGRMGNFINGELYGRVTDSPFGMVFMKGGPYPRHPSQLYEGISEGILLWLILWMMHKRVKHYGYISAVFLGGYGFFRYVVEFFREPDAQLGYYFGGTTTMGQILCLIMIGLSVGMYLYAKKKAIPVAR
jgi:phosphatidylglycerol:prolipoprotein diacylglycerol transferase